MIKIIIISMLLGLFVTLEAGYYFEKNANPFQWRVPLWYSGSIVAIMSVSAFVLIEWVLSIYKIFNT